MIFKSEFDTAVLIGEIENLTIQASIFYVEPTIAVETLVTDQSGQTYFVKTPKEALTGSNYIFGINRSIEFRYGE